MMDVPSSFVSGAALLALSTAVDMHLDGIVFGWRLVTESWWSQF